MLQLFFCLYFFLSALTYGNEWINHRFPATFLIDTESISQTYDIRYLYEEGSGKLLAKFYCHDGSISLRYIHQYDEQGFLKSKILDNGNVEDPNDLTGATDRWITTFTFDSTQPSRDAPVHIMETYINCLTGEEKILWQTGELHEKPICTAQNDDPLKHFLDGELANVFERLLGKTIFQLTGYYTHPSTSGVYGDGELNDKIRVTLISGILNYPIDQLANLEMFAAMHQRVNIHYIFRSCEGWSRDMVNCVISRFGFMVTEQALILANTWKKLIAEMGGPEAGGTIIHYAHSVGGSETYIAKDLLTEEEQKMIVVYTFGSPTLIPNGGFQKVVNYVSRRDGVCVNDPFRYINGLIDSKSNVVFVDTYLGIPFIDHTLTQPSYNAVLQELAEQFVNQYILQ